MGRPLSEFYSCLFFWKTLTIWGLLCDAVGRHRQCPESSVTISFACVAGLGQVRNKIRLLGPEVSEIRLALNEKGTLVKRGIADDSQLNWHRN